jgi:hypothetical protein
VAIGIDAMFKAIQLPAGVTNLGSSLSNVDGDYWQKLVSKYKITTKGNNNVLSRISKRIEQTKKEETTGGGFFVRKKLAV